MKRFTIAALLGHASLLGLAAPAFAQEATEPEVAADIIVTGSRIARDGSEAPTPVTVASTDKLLSAAPGSIAEGLNQLPVFQGSINATQTQVTQSNRVRSGNYLNLRNLGPQRLLVLQDGYRLPPTGNNGGVDVNIIPQMLVQRVEVVTGGASAVYGSDAVSGVVNYIVDKKFRGIKTVAQTGVSTYGDAFSYRLGAAGGADLLDDRLHIMASAERYSNDGIQHRYSRRGGDENWITGALDPTLASGPAGSINNPFKDYRDVYYTLASPGGLITGGPAGFVGQTFQPNGSLAPFDFGDPIGRSGVAANSGGIDLCNYCTLVPTQETMQFFGRADYEFSSNVSAFAQVSYNTAKSEDSQLPYQKIPGFRIFSDNYYLNQGLTADQLAALGSSTLTVRRGFYDWQGPGKYPAIIPSKQTGRSVTAMAGVQGEFGGGWKWDTVFTYGRTRFKSSTQELRNDRFFAAIDAVAGTDGSPVCRVTITNPGLYDDCRPLNVLGYGNADQSVVDWIIDDSRWAITNKMYLGAANISGPIFSTAAGEVSVAVGAEIRKQSLVQTSNSDPAIPVDYTGIRGASGGVFGNTNVGVANGKYTIKEFYGEFNAPLIADQPFFAQLTIDGALRYTDYSTSGGVTTYKLGGVWEPIDDIRFRASYSRDIRAPSLFELFAGQTIVQGARTDPATNEALIIGFVSGGNPDLKPEKSKTWTAGVVLKPSFLPGLTFSADYFNINMSGAISTPFTADGILLACAQDPGSSFCDLIERNAAGQPARIFLNNQNVSSLKTSGIDFEAGYITSLGNGTLSVRALATRLLHYKRQETGAADAVEYAGSADVPGFLTSVYPLPKWRGNIDVTYTNGGTTIGIQERMIGSYKKSFSSYYVDNHLPAVFYTDLNLSQEIDGLGGTATFFATVNNLFNRKGPFFVTDQNPATQLPTARAIYDIVGRYITVGVRTRF